MIAAGARTLAVSALATLALASCGGTEDAEPDRPSTSPGTAAATSSDVSTAEPEDEPAEAVDPPVIPDRPIARVRLEPVARGLGVPRTVVDLGGERLLIGDQRGLVRVLDNGRQRTAPLLDVRRGLFQPSSRSVEDGLVGLAVSPDFATSGVFWTFTTREPQRGSDALRADVVTRWQTDPVTLAPVGADTGTVLATLETDGGTHPAGQILPIDAGRRLLVSRGDPSGGDLAQDPDTLEGGFFVLAADRPSTPRPYAHGFRNPWRVTRDGDLGTLVADAMFSEKSQEIDVLERDRNYGYPFDADGVAGGCVDGGSILAPCTEGPDGQPLEPPAAEYPTEFGTIVSGVAVYRGNDIPALRGHVLISDWAGNLFAADPASDTPWAVSKVELPIPDAAVYLWSLTTGLDGEVYATVVPQGMEGGGALYRIVARG